MTKLDEGAVLETEDGEERWELVEKEVEFTVRMTTDGDDDSDGKVTTATYPITTLKDKIGRAELSVVGGGGVEGGEGEEVDYQCEECGATFDSQRGMRSHMTQVHETGESD